MNAPQIDLDKLEQVARAAAQDGWELNDLGGGEMGLRVRSGYQAWFRINRCRPELTAEAKASAEFFFAANPAVVLELVRRLRAAEADAKRREDYIEALHAERIGGVAQGASHD